MLPNDVTLCPGYLCYFRENCQRFMDGVEVVESGDKTHWWMSTPEHDARKCVYQIPIRDENAKTRTEEEVV